MTGTASRIPRSTSLVGDQFESVGVLCEDAPVATATTTTRQALTTAATRPMAPTARLRRSFSPALVTDMEATLRSGALTLPELRFALESAELRSEDDIRTVLAQTLRLKQAVAALGHDAQALMKRVHPHTVAFLLRSWSIDQE